MFIEHYDDPLVCNLITFGSRHMVYPNTALQTLRSALQSCFAKLVTRRRIQRVSPAEPRSGKSHRLPFFFPPASPTPHPMSLIGNWPIRLSITVTRPSSRDTSNQTTSLRPSSDINNERPAPHKNETYAANLAQFDALVFVLFTQDRTVIPKESS